ncbi:MAG TPA: hypothetical protein VJA21_19385 [Verrucomicrobiae bacterium]
MSRQRNKSASKRPPASSNRRKAGWAAVFVIVVLLVLAFTWSGAHRAFLSGPVGHTTQPFDSSVLVGRWERPDGGYILDISAAHADGRLEARYFNPQPIKVSKAEVRRWDQMSGLFLELRDVNYPGCTYNLAYLPAEDCLAGQYYQAAIRETFDVRFVRVKPGGPGAANQ